MKRSRKVLLIALGIPVICVLLIAGLAALSVATRSEPVYHYDDPELLWELAERTARFIIQSTDKGSFARNEALKALEDIALLEVPEDEKARLIRERFPEESFWTDDLKEVLKRAESGDAEAQFQLGCFYSLRNYVRASDADLDRGKRVMKSPALAWKWFHKAAMQGHAKAQSRLVLSMISGHPAYKNVSEHTLTLRIEEQLAREGDEWYTRAAMQGEPVALWMGFGPDKDEEKNRKVALAIFREAAEHGDVEAMRATASPLRHFHDLDGATEWIRKAAELGDVSSMLEYATDRERMMEPDDDSIPKDWEWRQKAFDAAMKQLDEGSASEIRKIGELSVPEYLERLTGGESEEEFAARVMPRLWELIERHGDYKDAPQVIRHLMGVAGLDYPTLDRMFAELGMYLYQIDYADNLLDSGVPEEQAEGIRLLRKLAGFGNPDAQCRLGACYLKGTGVPADKAEGVKWLRKAAEKRDTSAMRRLSDCLRTGDPPTSWFEAFQWSIRADAYPLYDSITEYLFHQVKDSIKNAWDDLRRH